MEFSDLSDPALSFPDVSLRAHRGFRGEADGFENVHTFDCVRGRPVGPHPSRAAYISSSPVLPPLQLSHPYLHAPLLQSSLKCGYYFRLSKLSPLRTAQNSIRAYVRPCHSHPGSICSPFPLPALLATSRPHAAYTLYQRHFCTHTSGNVALSALLFACVLLLRASFISNDFVVY